MAKRRYGEGSVFKRGNGRYCAVLMLPTGEKKYLYGATRAAVVGRLDEHKTLLREGKPMPNGQITVARFFADWLENAAQPRMRPLTYRYVSQKVTGHIVPALGKVRLVELTTPMVQRFLNAKHSAGLSAKTVKHLRDLLRTALNDAMRWRLIAYNAAKDATPPRAVKHHVEPLTPEEAKVLLAAVKGHRLAALFTVGLAVGLRAREALGLTWQDVDIDGPSPTLHVRHTLQRIDGEWQLNEPKTEASRRELPNLPPVVVTALKAHRKEQLAEQLKAGQEWRENNRLGLIFTQPKGEPVMVQNIARTFQGLLTAAGLKPRRFHDLRHACCSLLLAQGVPPGTVMEILGHSNLSTTMHIYREVTQQAKAQAMSAMDFLAV